jgi:hypothetical protein
MKEDNQSSFHYHRDERLALSTAPDLSRRGRKGPFKGNRGLLILLFDILFICLVAFLFRQFLFTPSYEAKLEGYKIVLKAYRVNEGTLAVVRIEGSGNEPAEEGREVSIRIRAGQSQRLLSETLTPIGLDASASFSPDPEIERIEAEVMMNGKTARLRRDIPALDD